MRFRLIVLVACTLFAASCGTSRKSAQSIDRHTQAQRVEAQRRSELAQKYETRPELEPKPAKVLPKIVFEGIECEHVRVKGVNPLPLGGLVISLDQLNEEFCYPYGGKLISDYGMRNGRMHTGIDIKAIPNDTIRAAFPGVVRMAKNYSSYGNIVVIRHYEGFETAYAHNSRNLVKVNDIVSAGDPIALAGRTGRATTEHLHFEVRAAGEHFDPKLVVDPQKRELNNGWLFVNENNGVVSAANSESGLTRAGQDAAAAIAATNAAREKAIRESTVDGKPKGPAEPEPVYYRVKKGDTLSGIARKHGTTVAKLCNLNKIKSTSLLQINQRLRVK